jgi:hypothetical protein
VGFVTATVVVETLPKLRKFHCLEGVYINVGLYAVIGGGGESRESRALSEGMQLY